MLEVKNILVPTDFSETSNAVLTYGRALAQGFGATMTILHVADVVTAGIGDAGGMYTEAQHDAAEAARAQADALLTADDRRLPHAQAAALACIAPAETIVAYAVEHEMDIIVMGTHGHGGMTHLLMGSVAEDVVRSAPCRVPVVKHAKPEGKDAR